MAVVKMKTFLWLVPLVNLPRIAVQIKQPSSAEFAFTFELNGAIIRPMSSHMLAGDRLQQWA
jgi:hypothetical protein